MNQQQQIKEHFLSLLLSNIDKKPKDIAASLGRSPQALNYHLSKMIRLNVLRKEQSYPYAIYELTDLGKRIKESLIQSENPRSLWRVHNLIIGFKILNLGSFNFVETTRRKLIHMNNWNYAREEFNDYVMNIQDTGLLKIYVPSKYSKDPDRAIGELIGETSKIAEDYINRYGMKLDRLMIIRKAEKELCNSEILAKLFGRIKLPGIYVNESNGFEALEEKQDSYSIERLLTLPDILEKQLIPALSKFSEQIEKHLAVLDRIGIGIEEFRDVIKELKKA